MLNKLKNKLEEKKAQGLSRNAIILMVIGIIVLVVLVIGFQQGFGNLAPFLSSNNVDDIQTGCSAACSKEEVQSYCLQAREVNTDNETLKGATCNYLDKKGIQHGIVSDFGCSSISCQDVMVVSLSEGETLQDYCNSENEGQILQAMVDGNLESYTCDN